MPDGIKVPYNLKSYDGLSNLDDCLMMFMGTMDVHKLPELVWCRIFSVTLCGAVRFWYEILSPESINNFHQLQDKFRANFLQQRRFQKTQAEIIGIQQREEESLKDYLDRFKKDTLHMVDSSDDMITGAFISELSPVRNVRELVASPFMKRIKDYKMPYGLKVPFNLKSYDGLSHLDEYLTMFMGTMDVHKLPEPAWCRIFSITLCEAARF
ncbi:gag protein [Tanacetum coccineum]|uniref:Gag protein n=1 Tax=Tanacetum coccineum TaxID=301880 RepID=A0ABQ5D0X2_9ASTR